MSACDRRARSRRLVPPDHLERRFRRERHATASTSSASSRGVSDSVRHQNRGSIGKRHRAARAHACGRARRSGAASGNTLPGLSRPFGIEGAFEALLLGEIGLA